MPQLGVTAGRSEPFNEGAVQVRRLVDRDRKEMLGNKVDILDKYATEFGDPDDDEQPLAAAAAPAASSSGAASASSSSAAAAAVSSSSSSKPASPFAAAGGVPAAPAAPAAVAAKFGGSAGLSSPFGTSSRTRSLTEPKGLSPDMGPDPIVKQAPTPGNFISRITLTQVVSGGAAGRQHRGGC